jgi:hypothetical protein
LFSLTELHAAIRERASDFNGRPMRGWETTRQALFGRIWCEDATAGDSTY